MLGVNVALLLAESMRFWRIAGTHLISKTGLNLQDRLPTSVAAAE